jgi:hypothetical protein
MISAVVSAVGLAIVLAMPAFEPTNRVQPRETSGRLPPVCRNSDD